MPAETDDELMEIAKNVELLSVVEARQPGFSRGHISSLAAAARSQLGEVPALAAAKALSKEVGPGDNVLIVTGAGGFPWLPAGETDGPPGAAALGRILDELLGAHPIFASESEMLGPVLASARALGLYVFDDPLRDVGSPRQHGAGACRLPWKEGTCDRAKYVAMMDTLQPTAVIAVEKMGPNSKGRYHSALGGDMQNGHAPAHWLFEIAGERGILTIGIGDNGNEIGFGRLSDAVEQYHLLGSSCRCGCGGSISDSTEVDITLVANVSNWGAYAIEACLATMMGHGSAMHTGEMERQSIEAAATAGACDGNSLKQAATVDGMASYVHAGFVDFMRCIAINGRTQISRPF